FFARGERFIEDRDLDAAPAQPLPIRRGQREALVVVEDGELQSGLMPLSLTTLPQRAISASSHFCKSAGALTTRSMPSVSVSVFFTSGWPSALASPSWNLSMTGFGVPAGANTPHQASAEKPLKPCSASAGMSGIECERLSPVTAMARSLPLFT